MGNLQNLKKATVNIDAGCRKPRNSSGRAGNNNDKGAALHIPVKTFR